MNYLFEKEVYDPQQYYWFKHALTKEEVKKVEEGVFKLPSEEGTTIGEGDDELRSSMIKWIPQNNEWSWLYQKMMDLAVEANSIWDFDLKSAFEQIQYTEYYASEKGHYNWHQDIGSGVLASRRKISITIQMSESDEYEGGELLISLGGGLKDGSFKNNLVCPRGGGVGVLFPSYMMHKVSPITKGTRKSLVLWVGGEHYR
jgi:PKHD-type hydroxylase